MVVIMCVGVALVFFFQAEDGIRDLVRSRGLGDVYKRQVDTLAVDLVTFARLAFGEVAMGFRMGLQIDQTRTCLLYTSDAADERSSVDLGGRRIIKKKNRETRRRRGESKYKNKQTEN